jgi:hypothetical protein
MKASRIDEESSTASSFERSTVHSRPCTDCRAASDVASRKRDFIDMTMLRKTARSASVVFCVEHPGAVYIHLMSMAERLCLARWISIQTRRGNQKFWGFASGERAVRGCGGRRRSNGAVMVRSKPSNILPALVVIRSGRPAKVRHPPLASTIRETVGLVEYALRKSCGFYGQGLIEYTLFSNPKELVY